MTATTTMTYQTIPNGGWTVPQDMARSIAKRDAAARYNVLAEAWNRKLIMAQRAHALYKELELTCESQAAAQQAVWWSMVQELRAARDLIAQARAAFDAA